MSNNFAYYLKYRPQTLDELIGQEAVKKTLLSSFQNNKLSHAYLFVGPRGTGKTSTARILAKMVNCEKGSDILQVPCNECATCLSITDGSNLDLIEIDAASNRSIEDVRSLRDKIKLAPTSAKKKVYIIDEVHMLTPEAFNALLKTLEEPPNHALFVLATTELGKIPQTILSRVQRLDFKLARPKEILEVLEKIIKGEKIDIEAEALNILIRRSDGSFRDGVKLLDQVSSTKGKITAKSLEENFKIPLFDDILDLIESLSQQSASKSLLNISKQIENGVDVRELTVSLMEIFRNLIFIKNGLGEQLIKPQFTEDKYEEVRKVSDKLSEQELARVLDILQKAIEKLKFASIQSLPLELAVVEICGEQIQNSNVAPSPKLWSVGDKSQNYSQEHERGVVDDERIRGDEPQDVYVSEQVSGVADRSSKSDELVNDHNIDILKLKERWTFVLETIRPFNFSLEALLRSINVTECTDTTVIMEVPYSFHQRILEVPKNKNLLESILSDILGRSIKISISLGTRPERKEDIANIDLAADDEIIRAAAEIFNSDTVN